MATPGNAADRRDYDEAASASAQENFNRVANRLETLISARDSDVKSAMADYEATGVSEEYHAKEMRWNTVATEVRTIIAAMRTSLEQTDATAKSTVTRAKGIVEGIA
ncbi:pore-forming ESAT-6 family protein [Georgenia sunbinii]|uniref:pore-forming ESAT-6 family protein n=1 Tax=Georgenia sunbinii TaxID=3117728 RepID=UPI002F2691CA